MPSQKPTLQPMQGTPMNDLFLSINRYVSTGDHLGEGMSIPMGIERAVPMPGDRFMVIIPCNTGNGTDVEDMARFKSRFAELGPAFSTKLSPGPGRGMFDVYTFEIAWEQCAPLAAALLEKPGPLGWGSMKELIDRHLSGGKP